MTYAFGIELPPWTIEIDSNRDREALGDNSWDGYGVPTFVEN